jgi:hypothetical protein
MMKEAAGRFVVRVRFKAVAEALAFAEHFRWAVVS